MMTKLSYYWMISNCYWTMTTNSKKKNLRSSTEMSLNLKNWSLESWKMMSSKVKSLMKSSTEKNWNWMS